MTETLTETLTLLSCYGLCFGLMNDKVPFLRAVRQISFFDTLLKCSYCTGFHCGWVMGLLRLVSGVAPVPSLPGALGLLLLWAFGSAAFCYLVDVLAQWVEAHLTET